MAKQTNTHNMLLWYGEHIPTIKDMGFVVPNPGLRAHTANASIAMLVQKLTKETQAVMLSVDARRDSSPGIDILVKIAQMVQRAINKIESLTTADNEERIEPSELHAKSSPFVLHPVPLYGDQIKSGPLKEYAEYILTAVADAMVHDDNNLMRTLTEDFRDKVVRWLRLVYTNLAVDFFEVSPKEAKAEGFAITQAMIDKFKRKPDLASSSWSKPTNPRFVFTSDQLEDVTNGIPAMEFPVMRPWPNSIPWATDQNGQYRPLTDDQDNGGDVVSGGPAGGSGMPAATSTPTI